MKNALLILSIACSVTATAALIAANAKAGSGSPGVVTVTGTLRLQKNPQRACGASMFGYIVEGQTKAADGTIVPVAGCLGGLAVPLQGTVDAGLAKNPYKAALKIVAKVAANPVTMTFAVEDAENFDLDSAVLLSIKPFYKL